MTTPVVRSVGTVSPGGNPSLPLAPAGKVNGDLLLLISAGELSPAVPTGWAGIPGSPVENPQPSGDSARLMVASRIATGSADDTPSVGGGSHLARILCIEGGTFDPFVPIGASGTLIFSYTINTPHDLAALTTTKDGSLVVQAIGGHYSAAFSAWVNANLIGFVERIDNNTNFSNRSTIAMATGAKALAGDIGVTQATCDHGSHVGVLAFEVRPYTDDKGVLPTSRVYSDEQAAGAIYKGSTLVWGG